MKIRWSWAALLCSPLCGCGTINNLADGPHVYGGVRSVGRYHEPMGNMISYLELPCSFALDTGILPITLLAELSRWITGWPPYSRRLYGAPRSDVEESKHQLSALATALELYRRHRGAYPTTDEGLGTLYRKAGSPWPETFDGIYLTGDGPPLDPWGSPYVYRYPGVRHPNSYDLFSSGPDRTPDTPDDLEEK